MPYLFQCLKPELVKYQLGMYSAASNGKADRGLFSSMINQEAGGLELGYYLDPDNLKTRPFKVRGNTRLFEIKTVVTWESLI